MSVAGSLNLITLCRDNKCLDSDERLIGKGSSDGKVDAVFTCPPYWNLEVYSQNPADLSRMAKAQFEDAYRRILSQSADLLKKNGLFGIVIGVTCHHDSLHTRA